MKWILSHIQIIKFIIALPLASFLGEWLIRPYLNYLKKKLGDEIKIEWLASLSGKWERAFFVAAWYLSFPEFIGLWLTLKVAINWRRWSSDEEINRGRFMIFLIGSGLSISIAVICAIGVEWLLNSVY